MRTFFMGSDWKFSCFCFVFPSACGGDLQGPSGTFTSPNYRSPNPHGWMCEWRITVQEGRRVTLTFDSLRLEAHPWCSSEHVTVSVPCSQGCYSPLFKELIDPVNHSQKTKPHVESLLCFKYLRSSKRPSSFPLWDLAYAPPKKLFISFLLGLTLQVSA